MTEEELKELSKEDKIYRLVDWIENLDEVALDELIKEFFNLK